MAVSALLPLLLALRSLPLTEFEVVLAALLLSTAIVVAGLVALDGLRLSLMADG